MKYAVEYKLPASSQGLMIFTADDENQAADYVAEIRAHLCLSPHVHRQRLN